MTETKAVLYARYSTDLQSDRSVADQFTLCREYGDRHNITVVGTYEDREKSSATLFDRPGLLRLMKDAKSGQFNAVLAEHSDRISRDQEDLPGLYKRLTFLGIKIITVSQGVLDETAVGLHGLVGGLFLKQLREKVSRGMKGRAREGKVMTGVAYGYRLVPGKPGEREIDPDQAKVIRRIFQEYIAGSSPRAIAMKLNADGVPSPGRRPWSHQNVSGGRSSLGAKGILTNRIYLGEIHYGLTKGVRNPETGKMVRRKGNSPVVIPAPHLRIIDDETWMAAEAVRDGRVKFSSRPRRPWERNDGLLAGMVECPCGSHMIVAQRSRSGAGRVKCSAAHYTDACDHTKSYDLPRLQKAVLNALETDLNNDADLEESLRVFLDEYDQVFRKRQREARRELDKSQRRLDEIEASCLRLVTMLEKGTLATEIIEERLSVLAVEKAALEESQRIAKAEISVIELHPSAIAKYREAVQTLKEDLSGGEMSPAKKMAFRNFVKSITVFPTDSRAPYRFKINGRLGALLGTQIYPETMSVETIIRENGGPADYTCTDNVKIGKAG